MASSSIVMHVGSVGSAKVTAPVLAKWEAASAVGEAAPSYNDAGWVRVGEPRDMSSDGSDTGYGWYRTSFVAPMSGTYWLQIPFVADSAEIFIDGERVQVPGNGSSHQRPVEVRVTVHGGANELAVLIWHYGRTKFFPCIGYLPGVDVKGMTGHVTLHPTLKWSTETGRIADGAKLYRTTFTYTPDPGHRTVLRFSSKGLSRGLVYLNGIDVGRYPQRIPVEGTLLPEPWLKPGKNTLAILDDQGNAPGDARVIVEEVASRTVGTLVN